MVLPGFNMIKVNIGSGELTPDNQAMGHDHSSSNAFPFVSDERCAMLQQNVHGYTRYI